MRAKLAVKVRARRNEIAAAVRFGPASATDLLMDMVAEEDALRRDLVKSGACDRRQTDGGSCVDDDAAYDDGHSEEERLELLLFLEETLYSVGKAEGENAVTASCAQSWADVIALSAAAINAPTRIARGSYLLWCGFLSSGRAFARHRALPAAFRAMTSLSSRFSCTRTCSSFSTS